MNRPPGQRPAATKTHRASPLLVALLCFSAGAVQALGIGRLPTSAVLGQALDLSIPIRLDDGEVLNIECAGAEVYFGDIRQQPGVINLALDPAPPNATERTLRLLTNTRIDEPFVTVELAIGCQSRTARRFTLFADPPLLTPPAAEPVTAPIIAAPQAPAIAPVPVSTPAPARTARATRPRIAVGAAPSARPAKRAAAATSSGPRLQLTPLERSAAVPARAAEPDAALIDAAAAAQTLAAEAAASAAAVAELDRARVQQLEASLQALRAETAQAQQAMSGVLARMQAAEADRYSNPLVFALLAACGLLLLALAWLWRLRVQDREAAAWQRTAGTGRKDVDTAEAIAFEQALMPTPAEPAASGAQAANSPGGIAFNSESTEVLPRSAQVPANAAPTVLALQAGEPARRAVSAEELIDLEQQAEFFIVLGQEEAAIDLLMGHLRSSSGSSPLPYLKLLELYRKRGNRPEYERVRENFNVRFSAYAPAWEIDLNAGRALEDYPSVIGRLQALWPTPSRALEVLQLTLARPEGDLHAGDSFELPAYRELMLLYSVARELADEEPVDTTIVDLLLPLEGGVEPVTLDWQPSVVERLTATAAVPPQPGVRQALHVDLPLDLSPPSADEAAAGPVGFRSTTIDETAEDGSPSEAGRRR